VLENLQVDQPAVMEGQRVPFGDRSFAVVISDYVLEHAGDPDPFLSEVYRVLIPGGWFFFRTPNVYHYVNRVARLTPDFVHGLVANRVRVCKAQGKEPHTTFDRMHSRKRFARLASARGI
jgi:SAM-dependent methyltransferase